MSSTRVYVGRLPYRARERDIEDFFRSYGRIRDIVLKNGFAFVEYDDPRDADDAVYEANGRNFLGERISVEHTRSRGRGRGGGMFDGGWGGRDRMGGWGGNGGGGWGGGRRDPSWMERDGPPGGGFGKYGPPTQTRHRLIVENLSTRVAWQELKDLMRGAGEVTYADAHKQRKNEGIVCFATRADLERALEKYQTYEFEGRELKLVDDSRSSRSRSRSPRRRSRSRSRRRTRSKSRSRSKSASKSASRSRSRSRTKSRSKSADRNNDNNDRSRSGTRSPSDLKKKSRENSVEAPMVDGVAEQNGKAESADE